MLNLEFGKKIVSRLRMPRVKYEPLVKVLVSKDAILHNYRVFKNKYQKLEFAPVLKSNAYGHGLVETASILDSLHPPFMAVDSFFEALVLRRAAIKSPILILGHVQEELYRKKTLKNLVFGILDLENLANIAKTLSLPLRFHLKVDTGMNRQGVALSKLDEAIALIKNNQDVILEGFFTHFADADNEDRSRTKKQIEAWNGAVKKIRAGFPGIKYFHATATAGVYYSNEVDANVSRLGLGLFGINPSPFDKIYLKPALSLTSIISLVKDIAAGERVGYGGTFEAKEPMKIATIPAGYNEGVDLRLSSQGQVLVGKTLCPIIGRVSMNITTIDITKMPESKLGQEVILISSDPMMPNSVENIAKLCNAIPYEILVRIPSNLRREVI